LRDSTTISSAVIVDTCYLLWSCRGAPHCVHGLGRVRRCTLQAVLVPGTPSDAAAAAASKVAAAFPAAVVGEVDVAAGSVGGGHANGTTMGTDAVKSEMKSEAKALV
jgi:hypothetical protein